MAYTSNYTGEQLDNAILNRHTQNTDTHLDLGGANEVSAADIKTVVDAANREVVVGALIGHHNSAAIADQAGESVLLTPEMSLTANTTYLVDIFVQASFENGTPFININNSDIDNGMLFNSEDTTNQYASITTTFALDFVGGDAIRARHLVGQLTTGATSDPTIRFEYVYDGNPGGAGKFFYFTAKLTEVLDSEEQ